MILKDFITIIFEINDNSISKLFSRDPRKYGRIILPEKKRKHRDLKKNLQNNEDNCRFKNGLIVEDRQFK
jgi:hypothetical protein